jgi:hypothetical protein
METHHLANMSWTRRILTAVDAYAREVQRASRLGGIVTLMAFTAGVVYAAFLVDRYRTQPPVMTSTVQWADTQGPFPMDLRCLAVAGCLVSNVHNKWSSNAQAVRADQQRCVRMARGDVMTINFTFTQDPHAGLVMLWDSRAASDDPGATPGSGVAVRADTNCPSCDGGVFTLWTPAVGGAYLANLIETTNRTSGTAPFRREWFLTYVSNASSPQEWAPCWTDIQSSQRDWYVQAHFRIMSAWYTVTVAHEQSWLPLLGTLGGAFELCIAAGAPVLAAAAWMLAWRQKKCASRVHPSAEGDDSVV